MLIVCNNSSSMVFMVTVLQLAWKPRLLVLPLIIFHLLSVEGRLAAVSAVATAMKHYRRPSAFRILSVMSQMDLNIQDMVAALQQQHMVMTDADQRRHFPALMAAVQ
jgi:hypothetical protein